MSDGRFAGVDWASEEHAVCVVDEQGRIVEGRRYRHNEPGIRALCARLVASAGGAGGARATRWAVDRAAAGCRADGDRGAPQPGQGDAPALQRRGRQERQL